MTIEIRANTILPADRKPVTLRTADGLDLVGELAVPIDREPVATLITLHPLPTHGGFMDSHVYRKAAWRLPALAGLAVLRFNTRGTASPAGRSQGTYDGGVSERYDVAAAIDLAVHHELPNPWLVGWSFGTDLLLMHGLGATPAADHVLGGILLSPPLHRAQPEDLDAWGASGKPLLVLVPELDDNLRPDEARAAFARVPQAEVIGVEGARHLWVGEKYVRRVHSEIVRRVAPQELGSDGVLRGTWDGPFEIFTDS
jgi:alpha/beta superfamily hydrolase